MNPPPPGTAGSNSAAVVTPRPARRVRPSVGLWLARVRARDWFHFLVLPAAALALPDASGIALARGVFVTACVLAFGYLVNGVGDRAMDSDPRKNALGGADPWSFALPLATLAALALVVAGLGSRVALACTSIALVSGVTYSVGPRLKRVPVVGTLMNVTHFTPLLFVGLDAAQPASGLCAIAVTFAGLLVANQLLHEAADADDDRAGRVRTTYLVLGPALTAMLISLCGGVVALGTWTVIERGGAHPLWLVHSAPHVLVFPLLLIRASPGASRPCTLRLAHRAAAAASGAIVFVLAMIAARG